MHPYLPPITHELALPNAIYTTVLALVLTGALAWLIYWKSHRLRMELKNSIELLTATMKPVGEQFVREQFEHLETLIMRLDNRVEHIEAATGIAAPRE